RLVLDARADALLHLAWPVEPGKFWMNPANLDWVGASLNLVRAAAERGTHRICVTGTCFEYDWPAERDCVERVTGSVVGRLVHGERVGQAHQHSHLLLARRVAGAGKCGHDCALSG